MKPNVDKTVDIRTSQGFLKKKTINKVSVEDIYGEAQYFVKNRQADAINRTNEGFFKKSTEYHWMCSRKG